jgi:hypothetical protein
VGCQKEIGDAALLAYQALFEDWYQERDGTVSREEFQVKVGILRQGFKTELEEAVLLLGSPKRKDWQRPSELVKSY